MLTIMAFLLLLPINLAIESPAAIAAAWKAAIASGTSSFELTKMVALSGIFYYL